MKIFLKVNKFLLLAFFALSQGQFALAEISAGSSISSDNYKVLDSQQSIFGGIASASSHSFALTATIGGLAIGDSSLGNFILKSGFLYFPKVVAPVLNSADAGDSKVDLSWTPAGAYQGWTISGYNVCTKSSGNYSCQNVNNVTSFSKTSLTNGTAYTFKIEAKDGLGNIIATSNERSATPVAPATPTPTPPPGGGGGGGGGGYYNPPTGTGTIIIKGIAYANSTVTIYLDGAIVSSVRSNSGANFEITLTNVASGARTVGISSEDSNGRKSTTSTFPMVISSNSTVALTDIFLAPTIDISASRVNRGDILGIFGQTAPVSEVNVHVASEETVTKVVADSNGAYSIRFDTKPLAEDSHTTKSRAILNTVVSPFSQLLQFIVGKGGTQLKTADLNKDGKVNIIDFSIMLYWWNTKNQTGLNIADINKDGKVNIVDFSIMLFQWS